MNAPAPRMWDGFFAGNERAWCALLLLGALLTHAYSIVVTGAKFWIDSIVYFQFAQALFDPEQLARLYQSHFGFQYQYVPPGLPLLIRALDGIFGEYLWPALAALQGLLSAFAVTYFVLAFRARLSRPAQLAAVVICGLHPYYMSFHAAALTESVPASLLLFCLGIAIRALDHRVSLRAALSALLPLSIVAAQFRPYLGLIGVLAAALIVFQCGKPRRIPLYALTVLAFFAGTLAFPLYRVAIGLGFFIPNVNALMLTHISYVAWDLDKETAQSLNTVVLNEEIRARLIGREAVTYDDAWHMFSDLVATGLSPAEARQKIADAAWQVRTSSFPIIERQLQLPLASIGFQYAAVCCQANRQLTRDMTGFFLFRHIRAYYRWNSGVDRGSYPELFDKFTEMTRATDLYSDAAENFYIARIRPYVTDSLKSLRDPLHLTFFVSDPLILIAWFGLFLCFWPDRRMTLLVMAVPFAVIYAVAVYTHIFGDNRHAHPLIPIIIVGFVKVVDDFFTRGYWSRFRERLRLSRKSRPANPA
jgi:hypothetical protein